MTRGLIARGALYLAALIVVSPAVAEGQTTRADAGPPTLNEARTMPGPLEPENGGARRAPTDPSREPDARVERPSRRRARPTTDAGAGGRVRTKTRTGARRPATERSDTDPPQTEPRTEPRTAPRTAPQAEPPRTEPRSAPATQPPEAPPSEAPGQAGIEAPGEPPAAPPAAPLPVQVAPGPWGVVRPPLLPGQVEGVTGFPDIGVSPAAPDDDRGPQPWPPPVVTPSPIPALSSVILDAGIALAVPAEKERDAAAPAATSVPSSGTPAEGRAESPREPTRSKKGSEPPRRAEPPAEEARPLPARSRAPDERDVAPSVEAPRGTFVDRLDTWERSLGELNPLGLLLLLATLAIIAATIRRLREVLPKSGIVPRVLSVGHGLLRIASFFVLVALVARLLRPFMGPALPWVLLAAAAAIGWSARDVLPDIVAGIVVTFERRVRPGVWIAGEGFAGTVENLGFRATLLLDARGHRVSVPNRRLLVSPVSSELNAHTAAEVSLRVEADLPPAVLRRALTDAVLNSPWVPPDARPVVLRDAQTPDMWHVKSAVLDVRYAVDFEGELAERTDAILRHAARHDQEIAARMMATPAATPSSTSGAEPKHATAATSNGADGGDEQPVRPNPSTETSGATRSTAEPTERSKAGKPKEPSARE